MFGVLEHRASVSGERSPRDRPAGSHEKRPLVPALATDRQCGVKEPGRDPATSGGRIDHAGYLDGPCLEGIETQEPEQAVVPPTTTRPPRLGPHGSGAHPTPA